MKIATARFTELDGWQSAKAGDFAELIWSDWERDWICTMLENGQDYLRIGDTMFNVVHERVRV